MRTRCGRGGCTLAIAGSCLLPLTNSAYVNFWSLSLSILLKILSTRYITDYHPSPFRQYTSRLLETCVVGSDLIGSVLILCMLNHPTDHLVDGVDNFEHLVVGDCPVMVFIVHLKDPWGVKASKVRQYQRRRLQESPPLLLSLACCAPTGHAAGTRGTYIPAFRQGRLVR